MADPMQSVASEPLDATEKKKPKSGFRVVALIQKQAGGHWQDIRPVRKLRDSVEKRADAEALLDEVVKAFPHTQEPA